MPAALPLPLTTCPLCSGTLRVASYGREYHLVCRQCWKTLKIWGPVTQAWRDPEQPDAPAHPPLPADVCGKCGGHVHEPQRLTPGYWELVCLTCGHADYAHGDTGAWYPIDRTPSAADQRAAARDRSPRWGAHLSDHVA